MPMFTRKGTIVRKARGSGRRQSTRRPHASAGTWKNVTESKSPLSNLVRTPEDVKPSPAKSVASTSVIAFRHKRKQASKSKRQTKSLITVAFIMYSDPIILSQCT
ncbi:hypothetical protein CHS0354_028940 [Potamilus streckersoni]|uniref:Uncharacterized protein n=1 Tax=Potamilus streckersoni TaxID=2493646 RepID=A0AAE0SJ46_9BIVA|nr:hypothetical protein CHS0354_028940 [Potamilus streckersoni]